MKKKTVVICILVVSTVLWPAVYAASNGNKTTQDSRKERLEQIDRYISQLRRDIENNYAARLAELQARQQTAVRLLEVTNKVPYALSAVQTEFAKTVLEINDYGFHAPWYLRAKTERMLQPKGLRDNLNYIGRVKQSWRQFAIAECRIAQRKNEILAGFAWTFAELEREKNYALSVRLIGLDRQLRENLAVVKPEPKHGVVTGIIYSVDCPVAIVGGKILHEEDSADGVTVLKIYPDQVEFKKGSGTWTQKVQQSPAAYWD